MSEDVLFFIGGWGAQLLLPSGLCTSKWRLGGLRFSAKFVFKVRYQFPLSSKCNCALPPLTSQHTVVSLFHAGPALRKAPACACREQWPPQTPMGQLWRWSRLRGRVQLSARTLMAPPPSRADGWETGARRTSAHCAASPHKPPGGEGPPSSRRSAISLVCHWRTGSVTSASCASRRRSSTNLRYTYCALYHLMKIVDWSAFLSYLLLLFVPTLL